jgi:S1-C subfamily serine protease
MNRKILPDKTVKALLIFIFIMCILFAFTGCSAITSILKSEINKNNTTSQQQESAEKDSSRDGNENLQSQKESDLSILTQFDNAISTVAQKVQQSVVNVKVTVAQEDVFGNITEGSGVGSGVIFTQDGYIITNNHVAGNAKDLTVTLYDGTEYKAKLVGADSNTDIAVIKIDTNNLKTADFATIEKIKVGQLAIAIGSPFGLQQSVTLGVISALGRDVYYSYESLPMVDLIQTDAAINPGNSGGALLNSSGQVIGINTMIYSTSGSNAGIGFAIPSDTAVNIAKQLIKYGKAKVPFLGIQMGNNATKTKGVYIESLVKGSSADKAGILAGDILTEFNRQVIDSPFALIAQLLKYNVGDKVDLKIYRNNDFQIFKVMLGEEEKATATN